ncbi:co-chaperone Hsc20 [Adhaeribacter sp. BT258]|uniref:Co-chaperone Hsc20 n=1 Tax=Adhaeribacter terrigena TaxID=2793070 RepID=A0ABS1BYD4_9BACT|nr:iron-sulfur cluster co-chaperone HscB C-terminal domain-containing protein [Adhaeribacter terrigena]MBK0402175.1 co-chaperone Hsc20 [Adhaeribacter terrigena]
MNYFEFYGLPESFFPDEKLVKAKFYEYSRKYHPDFHATAAPEKQREILELSTLNTNAYKTLSNFESRLAYILEQHNLTGENTKNELPPIFLMEVMELNEKLMELEFEFEPEAVATLQAGFSEIWNALENKTRPVLEQYENLPETEKPAALEQVKNYYLKRKYLLRIKETLATFANRF